MGIAAVQFFDSTVPCLVPDSSLFLPIHWRLLESSVPYLLPLHLPGIGEFTAYNLFQYALKSGSISAAVFALPLSDNHHELFAHQASPCWRYCVNAVQDLTLSRHNISFNYALDQRLSFVCFIYCTLKLDASEHDEFEDTSPTVGESGTDDSSSTKPRRYSVTCGISHLFWGV
jgi:hypothetical protein